MAVTAYVLADSVFTAAVAHVPVLLTSCLLLLETVAWGRRRLVGAARLLLGVAVATADQRAATRASVEAAVLDIRAATR